MAIYRESPKCLKCGEPINGRYLDQSNVPDEMKIIGDTFIDWDYEAHNKVCEMRDKSLRAFPTDKKLIITLEEARKLYKELGYSSKYITDLLLKTFTKEELEKEEEDYSWEKCFKGRGYNISDCSLISGGRFSLSGINKNIFLTEKQAKSALAEAQLSHIVYAMNNVSNPSIPEYRNGHYLVPIYTVEFEDGRLKVVMHQVTKCKFPFFSKEQAEKSLQIHERLWKEFWEED